MDKKLYRQEKGVALILVVFLMLVCSLAALVAFSLLVQGTATGQGLHQSIQAQAITIAGKEWYLEQLDNNNWAAEFGKTYSAGIGEGSFDVNVTSATANTISFKVTGEVPSYFDESVTVQRKLTLTAKKLPKACQFGAFWQEDPGRKLTLESSWVIGGNFWSVGSVDINAPSAVTVGKVYYSAGKTVAGDGTYTTQKVQPPPPGMPEITSDYSEDIDKYNNDLDYPPATYYPFLPVGDGYSPELILRGPVACEVLITYGTCAIKGYGKIVAKQGVYLNLIGNGGILTIQPDAGKTIEILSRGVFWVNSFSKPEPPYDVRKVDIKPGTVLYSRNDGNNPLYILQFYPETPTSITGATILAKRNLIAYGPAGLDITDTTLYVDYCVDPTNNYLLIAGPAIVSGRVISRGTANPALTMIGPNVSGLVYQYGGIGQGTTQINYTQIHGSLLARQFTSDKLGPSAAIFYDLPKVLSAASDTFAGGVITETESWDDR